LDHHRTGLQELWAGQALSRDRQEVLRPEQLQPRLAMRDRGIRHNLLVRLPLRSGDPITQLPHPAALSPSLESCRIEDLSSPTSVADAFGTDPVDVATGGCGPLSTAGIRADVRRVSSQTGGVVPVSDTRS